MTIASQVAHRLRQLGVVIFVALLLGGAYVGSLRLTGNFNPVVDGEVYRSAQLSPVRAGLAVNEKRLFGLLHQRDQIGGLRRRQFAPRRHAKIEMGYSKFAGFSNFRVIPRFAQVVAAQVDDRLDAVFFRVGGDL